MAKSLVESVPGDHQDSFGENALDELDGPLAAEPPHPINWANEAEVEAETTRPRRLWPSKWPFVAQTPCVETRRHLVSRGNSGVMAGVPGLEPRTTEPESAVLPITPYPNARSEDRAD